MLVYTLEIVTYTLIQFQDVLLYLASLAGHWPEQSRSLWECQELWAGCFELQHNCCYLQRRGPGVRRHWWLSGWHPCIALEETRDQEHCFMCCTLTRLPDHYVHIHCSVFHIIILCADVNFALLWLLPISVTRAAGVNADLSLSF